MNAKRLQVTALLVGAAASKDKVDALKNEAEVSLSKALPLLQTAPWTAQQFISDSWLYSRLYF